MTRVLPWVVATVSFVLSLVLAAPGLTWLDGGELALAAGSMGVAHPPGEPAYLVLARLAALLPIGDLPFRLTLLSAATVAASAGLLTLVVARGAGRLRVGPGGSLPLAGLVAGLAFALAPGVQLQAARPELYGLAILLGLLAVAALQIGGRRGLALAVLPLCVAGAVHHAMLVAAVPGLVLLALGRGKGSLKVALGATGLLLLPGLLQFAWLPLRSLAEPALDFGTPRDLGRILWSVSAAGYARSFQPDGPLVLENLAAHGWIFARDLGWPMLSLAALGLCSTILRSPRLALACVLLVVIGVLPTALQGVFREDNPDARGYLLAVYAVLCAGAGVGAIVVGDRLRRGAPRLAPGLAPVLLLILLLPVLGGGLSSVDHSDRFLPARLGAVVLDGAEPGALVLLSGDSWTFSALYSRYWEGRRPDVEVRPLHFLDRAVLEGLSSRGITASARELLPPEVEARIPAKSRPEHLLRLLVAGALPGHPIQVNETFLPQDLVEARTQAGLLYRLGAGLPSVASEASEEDLWTVEIEPLLDDPRYLADPIGPDILARRYASRAGHHLEQQQGAAALQSYRRASQLASDPWDLVHLLRSRLEQEPERATAASPPGLAVAERAFMAGDIDLATEELTRVLSGDPTQHRGLLLAERLYSLGRRAERGVEQ